VWQIKEYLPPEMKCSDILTIQLKASIVDLAQPLSKRNSYNFELFKHGHLRGISPARNDTPNQRLLLQILQNIAPPQCHASVIDELLACNETFFVENENDVLVLNYQQKFKRRKVENPIYAIEEMHNVFQTYIQGTFLYPLNIARDMFIQIIHAFSESEINKYLAEVEKLMKHQAIIRRMRLFWGKL